MPLAKCRCRSAPPAVISYHTFLNLGRKVMAKEHDVPVDVYAVQAWQNGGASLSQGEKLDIGYKSGTWTANKNDNPPKYYDGNGSQGEIAANWFPLPGHNVGCLIGKFADGAIFEIGNGKAGLTGSGQLQIMINDALGGLGDNDGVLHYKISVY
jgi:hypothetical protein